MKQYLVIISFLLIGTQVKAQKIKVQDLAESVGQWRGELTYLDYTSGKPYTLSADLKISLTSDKKGYITHYEYPKEPQANSVDTTYVTKHNFGLAKIIEFKKDNPAGFILITELDGEDGNDHQKAVLRHTYQLQENTFSIRKDVKFRGTELWIKRHEYLFKK